MLRDKLSQLAIKLRQSRLDPLFCAVLVHLIDETLNLIALAPNMAIEIARSRLKKELVNAIRALAVSGTSQVKIQMMSELHLQRNELRDLVLRYAFELFINPTETAHKRPQVIPLRHDWDCITTSAEANTLQEEAAHRLFYELGPEMAALDVIDEYWTRYEVTENAAIRTAFIDVRNRITSVAHTTPNFMLKLAELREILHEFESFADDAKRNGYLAENRLIDEFFYRINIRIDAWFQISQHFANLSALYLLQEYLQDTLKDFIQHHKMAESFNWKFPCYPLILKKQDRLQEFTDLINHQVMDPESGFFRNALPPNKPFYGTSLHIIHESEDITFLNEFIEARYALMRVFNAAAITPKELTQVLHALKFVQANAAFIENIPDLNQANLAATDLSRKVLEILILRSHLSGNDIKNLRETFLQNLYRIHDPAESAPDGFQVDPLHKLAIFSQDEYLLGVSLLCYRLISADNDGLPLMALADNTLRAAEVGGHVAKTILAVALLRSPEQDILSANSKINLVRSLKLELNDAAQINNKDLASALLHSIIKQLPASHEYCAYSYRMLDAINNQQEIPKHPVEVQAYEIWQELINKNGVDQFLKGLRLFEQKKKLMLS